MFILDVCGYNMDPIIPNTVSLIIKVIQIVVPILIIIWGMLDLAKAVIANEEKEMKEAQGKLIKRIIYGVLVFFIIALVKTVFGVLANNAQVKDANSISCIDAFISGVKENTVECSKHNNQNSCDTATDKDGNFICTWSGGKCNSK